MNENFINVVVSIYLWFKIFQTILIFIPFVSDYDECETIKNKNQTGLNQR